MDGSDWVWMSLVMVAFWSLVAVAVVMIARNLRAGESRPAQDQPAGPSAAARAVETLDRRFASGEIDVDEYRSRRDALHESAH